MEKDKPAFMYQFCYFLIIQVLLRGDKKDILVGVIITKSSPTQYTLNNTPSKKENIKELRKLLGIDLSNLCQFLPQDRVADFVNQTPQIRLREFEKSVGGNDFVRYWIHSNVQYENHQQLIQYQQEQNAATSSIMQKEQELNTQKQIHSTLRREKDKFDAKNELKKKVSFKFVNHLQSKLLSLHIKMVQYDNDLHQYRAKREESKEIKRQIKVWNGVHNHLQEEEAKFAPLQQMITNYQNSIQHLGRMQALLGPLNHSVSNEERKIAGIVAKSKEWSIENHELYNQVRVCGKDDGQYNREYKVLQNIDKKRMEMVAEVRMGGAIKGQLKRLQRDREDIQRQLEQLGDVEIVRDKIKRLNEEIQWINDEVNEMPNHHPQKETKMKEFPDLDPRRRELTIQLERAKKAKDRLTNKDNAKMDHLKKIDRDTFKALEWLNQNRDRFKMTIYGPIMNEVSFREEIACKWFENTVRHDVMLSFVTQCTEDYDLFVQEVRTKLNMRVNVINVDVRLRGGGDVVGKHPLGAQSFTCENEGDSVDILLR